MSVKWMSLWEFLIFLGLLGCAGAPGPGEYPVAAGLASTAPAKYPVPDESPVSETKTARRVIREGELRFATSNRNATQTEILGLVKAHHGYLSDDREQRDSDRLEQTMTVRVPAGEFDEFLAEVSASVAHLDKREIHAIDVTAEFVDVEARLKTKKETESRYRELLAQAKSVEEILKIEEQIDKLRAEIESAEGRLRLMQDRESYSTLAVSFYEEFTKAAGLQNRVIHNFSLGWHFAVEITIGVVTLWPLILLALIVFLGTRWFNRKRISKKVSS